MSLAIMCHKKKIFFFSCDPSLVMLKVVVGYHMIAGATLKKITNISLYMLMAINAIRQDS